MPSFRATPSFVPEDALHQGGLRRTLDQLGIELEGISRVSVERIGDILAKAITDGAGSAKAAELIAPILNDPRLARVIARTEIARAMEGAMWERGKAAAGLDKRWSDAPNSCPICQANRREGVIPISQPFAGGAQHHPSIRWAVVP